MTEPAPPPVLLLMVRDEEAGIERPLRSSAALGLREVLLVDTGSTDATLVRACDLASELGLSLSITQLDWPDSFAEARNACLERAKGRFPGRNVLFLDADDEVTGSAELTDAPLHHVQMRMGNLSWPMLRVVRLVDLPRYVGTVHEQIVSGGRAISASGLVVRHHAGKSSRPRWERDRALLRAELESHQSHQGRGAPVDSGRTRFYLAQTHECLDELHEAAAHYRAFVRGARGEHALVALLRLASLLERDPSVDPGLGRREEHILALRLEAHEHDPSRPEPLVDAAWAFLRAERWASAYLFAHAGWACAPREDALFLRRTARRNETANVLSRACLHAPGKIDEGLALTRDACLKLAGAPVDWPRLNLALYRQRLGIAAPFPEEGGATEGGPPDPLEHHNRVVPRHREKRKAHPIPR